MWAPVASKWHHTGTDGLRCGIIRTTEDVMMLSLTLKPMLISMPKSTLMLTLMSILMPKLTQKSMLVPMPSVAAILVPEPRQD